MEFLILAIIALVATIYLYRFFRGSLKGDCSCKAGTCNANCKSKNSCKKQK